MKVIHFAKNSERPEIVELLAHQVSRTNRVPVIKDADGKIKMTGGHIIMYSEKVYKMLKILPSEHLFSFLTTIKTKATDNSVKEVYHQGIHFKRGEVIVANSDYGQINKLNATLTKGKMYAALSDSRKGTCGDLVTIIDDKGREISTYTTLFDKVIEKY
jgi:hypothetical protein